MKFIVKLGKKEKDLQALLSEVNILRNLRHPNIIQMLDVFETKNEICVVTELAHGELFDVLEDDKSLPEPVVQTVARQVVCALDYLHSHRIIHRDIKPQNVLFCNGGRVALCDFGFARLMSQHTTMLTSIKGTPLYMAPELVKEQPYNHTADLWSLGVILYELRVGKPPFFTNNIYKLIRMIVNDPVRYPPSIPAQMRSFLELLLVKDPKLRAKWPQVRSHPWIELPSLSCKAKPSTEDRKRNRRAMTSAPTKTYWQKQEKMSRDPAQAMALLKSKEFSSYVLSLFSEAVETKYVNEIDASELLGALKTMGNIFHTKKNVGETGGEKTEESKTADREHDLKRSSSWMKAIFSFTGRCLGDSDAKSQQPKGEGAVQSSTNRNSKFIAEGIRTCSVMASAVFTNHSNIGVPDAYAEDFLPLAPKFLKFEKGEGTEDDSSQIVPMRALEYTDVLLRQAAADPQNALSFYGLAIHEQLAQALASTTASGNNTAAQTALKTLAYLVHPRGKIKHISYYPLSSTMDRKTETHQGTKQMSDAEYISHLQFSKSEVQGNKDDLPVVQRRHRRLDSEVRKSVTGALEINSRIVQGVLRHLGEVMTLKNASEGDEAYGQAEAALQILLHTSRLSPIVSAIVARSLPTLQFLGSLASPTSNIPTNLRGLGMMVLSVLCNSVVEAKTRISKELKFREISNQVAILPAELERTVDIKAVLHIMTASDTPAIVQIAASHLCASLSSLNSGKAMLSAVEDSLPSIAQAMSQYLGRGGKMFKMEALEGNSFGVLIDGVMDGFMFVLRVLARKRAMKIGKTAFQSGTWMRICDHLNRRKKGAMSFQGLNAALETLSLLAASQTMPEGSQAVSISSPRARIFTDELIATLIELCREGHIKTIKFWPEDLGGGVSSISHLLLRVLGVLGVPFKEGATGAALEKAKVMKVAYNQLFVRQLLLALREIPPTMAALPPLSFICRLVLEDRRGFFARQFAEHRGPASLVAIGLLSSKAAPAVVVETLVILSHLARKSRDPVLAKRLPRPGYLEDALHSADMYEPLAELLTHRSGTVRAKACNLVGNLCSNSSFFYKHLKKHKLISPLIECCADSDSSVRAFAVIATGNAGFHGSELYSDLESSVPILEARLRDTVSGKMRANAAGALGNFVRNSGVLVEAEVKAGVIKSLLNLSLNDDFMEARRIALYTLGNILKFEEGRKAALKPELRLLVITKSIARVATDQTIVRNCMRIERILNDVPIPTSKRPATSM
eukprot:CAMPEP_0167746712 /NCGR_PEP_ID=MMETSP0110_2-20121227/3866_1 /TAXON_ID=629695 /ORGANISM="Gymnochlora sp., Strain CCMP2014" /LENGTH=1248 /DNA_ID=CAMNT_0007631509 /DNA_START=186 /DNA_END=3929 /DNA_ORIENTATION=-